MSGCGLLFFLVPAGLFEAWKRCQRARRLELSPGPLYSGGNVQT